MPRQTLATMRTSCERCKAEYEIDERRMQSGRIDVQCKVCGHVFAVAQPGVNDNTSATIAEGVPDRGGWLLQTADGKMHRFHSLPSLHKWIIGRRVTRQDKISHEGHAWRPIGEVAELAPYFDVVDQSDRARSIAGSALEQAAVVEPTWRSPTRLAKRPSSGEMLATSVPNDGRGAEAYLSVFDGDRGHFPPDGRSHGALKTLVGLIVAAGVAFVGIRWQEDRDTRWRDSNTVMAATVPEASSDRFAPADSRQVSVHPAPTPTAPVVEALPSPPPSAEPAVESASAATPAITHPESFEKLIAEADRALENGSSAKAKDLYQKALRLWPGGARALAGLGFVALDRGQIPAAYKYFKRALAAKASFPPALFGMAEIHRARGERTLALQSYQHYLQIAPKGSEAAAARRQVTTLQGAR